MENMSACNYQQDSGDEANDAGSKDCKCKSDEKYKTAPPHLGCNSEFHDEIEILYLRVNDDRFNDEANDAGSEDRICKSDEKYKTGPPLQGNDLGFGVSDSDDSLDLDNSSGSEDSSDSDETDLLTTKHFRKKLISAVKNENKDIVKSLLYESFNTSYVFVKSWSSDSDYVEQEHKFEIWEDAMYIAMKKDTKQSEEIIELLLDCDIIWSRETIMNNVIFHRLILHKDKGDGKNLRLTEILLKSGIINVNARNKLGWTALHLSEVEKFTSLLIHHGADVNKKDKEGKTPLMHVVGTGVSVLQTLLKEARTLVDLDAVDCKGRTALMIAASGNKPDAVDVLLNAGASVNLPDHLGFTALHHALFTGFDQYDQFPRNSEEFKKRLDIFKILFDTKDERWDCYWRNKEWIAKRVEIVEMLLQRPDIDVNALSFENFSPLDIAEGWIPEFPSSIKNVLIEKGAVLNVFRETESQSAGEFHLDVRCRLALQRLLYKAFGHTPLRGILSVDLFENRVLTLVEVFSPQIVSGKDQQGRTALHLVAIFFSIIWTVNNKRTTGDDEKNCLRDLANTILKELISTGCNVNETDIYGRTALHYAYYILKDSLISHGADASIKDKDGNRPIAIEEIPQQYSLYLDGIVKAVINRNDETCFLRRITNKQMEIEIQRSDSKVIGYYDDREFCLKTVPRLLWENGKYAIRNPSVEKIINEVTDLMIAISKEIGRLDPRFESKPEFVGSSNEGTRLNKPDEFDFCFVLKKISELCEVSLSPELPTGFVRLRRKPTKVREESDFDSFFGKDGILNTEKLTWQFTTILSTALVNIESQQSLDWNFELPNRKLSDVINKAPNIKMIKTLNLTSLGYISIDIVPCIHIEGWWPDEALSNVSDEIKTIGCNLIYDRPHELYPWVPYSESCARISFSKAESDMIKQSCANAREAYMIGKTMTMTSYHFGYILKNCLLYCIEALTPTSEKASQLGLSLEEMTFKFHQMDRYLWLKCLMKCHLDFASQDFCPCYFLPNFSSPNGKAHLKEYSLDWMMNRGVDFAQLCKNAGAFLLHF